MNKFLVEFLGTLFFLYVIIATGNALAIGAALTIAIMLGGKISGGNFNPAVTIMMIAAGNTISPKDAEGATILVCFRRDVDTGDLQPATFEPISKDNRDMKIASSGDGVTTDSPNYQQESIDGQFPLES